MKHNLPANGSKTRCQSDKWFPCACVSIPLAPYGSRCLWGPRPWTQSGQWMQTPANVRSKDCMLNLQGKNFELQVRYRQQYLLNPQLERDYTKINPYILLTRSTLNHHGLSAPNKPRSFNRGISKYPCRRIHSWWQGSHTTQALKSPLNYVHSQCLAAPQRSLQTS